MSEDLISRSAAIESIEHHIRTGDPLYPLTDADRAINYALNVAMSCVENVPAEERRKNGRWIHDGCDIPHGVDWMHCSVCGRREPHVPAAMTNFCPGCGAKMEGAEVEE